MARTRRAALSTENDEVAMCVFVDDKKAIVIAIGITGSNFLQQVFATTATARIATAEY